MTEGSHCVKLYSNEGAQLGESWFQDCVTAHKGQAIHIQAQEKKKRKNLKQRNENGPTYHVLSRFTLIHSILHPHLCMRASQCGSGASVSEERVRHLGWILSVSRTTDVTRPTCTRGGA